MRSPILRKNLKKKSTALLKRILWKVFSKYVRQRDKGICFTCGAFAQGANYHAGHFIPKGAGGLALYFHEDNVHGQCAKCNLFLQGNQYEYGKKLGEQKVHELYKLKQQITKDYPFEEKIEYYKKKLAEYEG